MQLNSKVSPVYLPEPDQTSVLRLGLKKLVPAKWLVVDEDFMQFYRNKLHLRKIYADKVYQALPGSEPAQWELQRVVLNHLENEHSNNYTVLPGRITHTPCDLSWSLDDKSLWQTSLWTQEDICLMELRGDDYYLTAASVCAPSNWALEKKIDRSLDDIHQPVPGYGQQFSRRVNRLFASLKPQRPLLRFNWSVQDSAELFWRKDLLEESPQQQPMEECYWRVERQTLRRLPETGAIVFTIRIFIHSFSTMVPNSEFSANWQRIIDQLPHDQRKYKGLASVGNKEFLK